MSARRGRRSIPLVAAALAAEDERQHLASGHPNLLGVQPPTASAVAAPSTITSAPHLLSRRSLLTSPLATTSGGTLLSTRRRTTSPMASTARGSLSGGVVSGGDTLRFPYNQGKLKKISLRLVKDGESVCGSMMRKDGVRFCTRKVVEGKD